MRKVLGLDLGTNSIGWALITEKEKNVPDELIDGGVRIFQEAVDAKFRTPKNRARRDARMIRRVIQRRRRRKARLRNYLISIGWLPPELADRPDPESWFNSMGDPYALRKRGLDKELSAEEFSRVLLHLCARRGFLSNRKTLLRDLYSSDDPDLLGLLGDRVDGDVTESEGLSDEQRTEESAFKKEIADLREEIAESGARTLGEHLAGLPLHERKRAKRTDRAMFEHEFNQLWNKQQEVNSQSMRDDIRLTTHEIIFFQRPLKLKKNRRGRCSLEPSRFRAAKGTLEAQEFRLLQDVNNLRFIDLRTGEWLLPSQNQRLALLEALHSQATMSWSKIKKIIGLNSRVTLNLQESKPHLTGNRTVSKLRSIDADFWDELESTGKQYAFAEDLLTIRNRYALYNRLTRAWQLPRQKALEFAATELEPGFANLSLKAMRQLLPFLRKGKIYSDARIAAGYGYEVTDEPTRSRLGQPPEVRNPVVQKSMHEVRKLVNAVIREFGKPDAVRIEMARDLKQTAKQRAAYQKQRRANESANAEAGEQYKIICDQNPHLRLREYPSRDDLIRYRLWKEAAGICIYTGRSIGLTELWSPSVEVDHILPYSRALDDSYMNKVVCFAEANRAKGNRLPFEAWSKDQVEQIVQHAKKFPRPKIKRIIRREMDSIDDFISRQLNDTRYISRLVLGFVRTAIPDVSISTGASTAFLRSMWGLTNIVGDTGEKTRDDHRHHFVDAVVVALTNRRIYQKMATEASRSDDHLDSDRLRRLNIPAPMANLREKVQKRTDKIVVSHAVNRKLTGALHEDTFRGALQNGDISRRVLVDASITASNILKIVDDDLRKRLQEHLDDNNGNTKEAFAQPFSLGKGRYLRHVKIRSAKTPKPGSYMELKDQSGQIQRRANFGNTHHVEVYRDSKGKPKGRFVTMFEAARRVKPPKNLPPREIIDHSVAEGEHFLFALHINDAAIAERDGQGEIFRVQKLERDTGKIVLREITAARLDRKDQEIRKSISTLVDQYKMYPVDISILGRIN